MPPVTLANLCDELKSATGAAPMTTPSKFQTAGTPAKTPTLRLIPCLLLLGTLALSGCGTKPIREGYVSFVWYEAGANDMRQIDATRMPGSEPYVRLYPDYLEVIYTQPANHQRADYVVPSTSLRVLRWR